MKEVTLYRCEICGTQFANKVDAINCETCHIKLSKKKIKLCKYRAHTDYPDKITVEFEDGKCVGYSR